MFRHSYSPSVTDFVGICAIKEMAEKGGTAYFRNGREVILTTLLKLREHSVFFSLFALTNPSELRSVET